MTNNTDTKETEHAGIPSWLGEKAPRMAGVRPFGLQVTEKELNYAFTPVDIGLLESTVPEHWMASAMRRMASAYEQENPAGIGLLGEQNGRLVRLMFDATLKASIFVWYELNKIDVENLTDDGLITADMSLEDKLAAWRAQ